MANRANVEKLDRKIKSRQQKQALHFYQHVRHFDQWRFFPPRFARHFSRQTPIVKFKTTRLPRLHGTRNHILLKTLHVLQRFQNHAVFHSRCVNENENDTVTHQTCPCKLGLTKAVFTLVPVPGKIAISHRLLRDVNLLFQDSVHRIASRQYNVHLLMHSQHVN